VLDRRSDGGNGFRLVGSTHIQPPMARCQGDTRHFERCAGKDCALHLGFRPWWFQQPWTSLLRLTKRRSVAGERPLVAAFNRTDRPAPHGSVSVLQGLRCRCRAIRDARV